MGPKVTNNNNNNDTQIKAKRGRKSKKELMDALNMTNIINTPSLNKTEDILKYNDTDDNNTKDIITDSNDCINDFINDSNDCVNDNNVKDELVIKKRGRKPKGGKIIQQTSIIESYKEDKPNVILHLKCSLKDINNNFDNSLNIETFNFTKNDFGFDYYGNNNINVTNYNLNNNENNNSLLSFNDNLNRNLNGNLNSNLNNNDFIFDDDLYDYDDNINKLNKEKDKTKEIWRKLKLLEQNLHVNNINNKKSCCFWDTCEFDGPPVYAPKYRRNGIIFVEGCFCCPQCAAAYIINKPNIDNSSKFECLYLLNYLYGSIYGYTKNINPAPDPRYMLQKFLGNLTVQEYRSILGNERLFLIVDKPLTRILPELHEYNDEFILNNKIIPSNNYQLKTRLQKKKQDKTSILNEQFGIGTNQICE